MSRGITVLFYSPNQYTRWCRVEWRTNWEQNHLKIIQNASGKIENTKFSFTVYSARLPSSAQGLLRSALGPAASRARPVRLLGPLPHPPGPERGSVAPSAAGRPSRWTAVRRSRGNKPRRPAPSRWKPNPIFSGPTGGAAVGGSLAGAVELCRA